MFAVLFCYFVLVDGLGGSLLLPSSIYNNSRSTL